MAAAMTQLETALVNLTQQVKKRDGQLDAATQDLAAMSSELQAIRSRFQERGWISNVGQAARPTVYISTDSDVTTPELTHESTTSSDGTVSDVPEVDTLTWRASVARRTSLTQKKNAWERWNEEEHPDVFQHLLLAEDAGLLEVKKLYNHWRWVSVLSLTFYVLYNVGSVILLDCRLIWFPGLASAQLGIDSLKHIEDKFYMSANITDSLFMHVLGLPAPDSIHIFASLELFLLFMQFINVILCGFHVYRDTGFIRWYHAQYVFLELIPRLSVFSNMFLLRSFAPRIASEELFKKIADIQEASARDQDITPPVLKLLLWVPELLFRLLFGFDTALMKLRVVGHYAKRDTTNMSMISTLRNIFLPVAQFLCQIVGVVQLGSFVRARLFLFIFGGKDAIMQPIEIRIMDTWSALLAKRMWHAFAPYQFVAVMMTFSTEDFQFLVVDEDPEAKAKVLSKQWKPSFTMERRRSSHLSPYRGCFATSSPYPSESSLQ